MALRIGFDATVRSKDFLADAAKAKLELNPMGGEELGKLVIDSGKELTPEMVTRIKKMIGGK